MNNFLRNKSKFYLWAKTRLTDPRKRYFEVDHSNYLRSDRVFEVAMKPMLTVRDVLARYDISLTVVILPYAAQLRSGSPSQLEPQAKIAGFLKRNGIRYIDGTQQLADRGQDLYLFGDPMHFNTAGHAAMFDLLSADLETQMGRTPQ